MKKLIALSLMLFTLPAFSVVTVDTFDYTVAPAGVYIQGGQTNNDTMLPTDETIGGARYLEVFGNFGAVSVSLNYDVAVGQCAYSSDSGYDGSFRLTYGYVTALNADLSESGQNDRFRFAFTAINAGTGGSNDTFEIQVTSGAGADVATSVIDWPAETGFFDMAFTSFSGTVDWTDIDKIDITVDGQTAADVMIDSIGVVPEPATASMLGLAGLIVYLARRHFID